MLIRFQCHKTNTKQTQNKHKTNTKQKQTHYIFIFIEIVFYNENIKMVTNHENLKCVLAIQSQ